MGFRFRRSIKIAPGIRLNVGKKGLSVSAGVRGASFTVGSRGTYSNVGIPGTGLSYRQRLDSPSQKRQIAREQRLLERQAQYLEEAERRSQALSRVKLTLQDDGAVRIEDSFGNPLSKSDHRLLWEQKSDMVASWLKQEAEKINGDVELLTSIHEDTPPIDSEPEYPVVPFGEEPPEPPTALEESPKPSLKVLPKLGFFANLFKKKRVAHVQEQQKLEEIYKRELESWGKAEKEKQEQYDAQLKAHQAETAQWEERKRAHEASELLKKEKFPELLRTDVGTMDQTLEMAMNSLSWPRETSVSYQIMEGGREVWLDVDLPEIEDLPQRVAALAANGRKLNIKDKAQKQLQEEYALHIHGIAFRLTGTVFASLPTSQKVVISGYSQRLDKATGNTNDDYLFSIKADREGLSKLNFDAIDKINPIEAMGIFEIQRKMTSTFIFKAIEPYQPQ